MGKKLGKRRPLIEIGRPILASTGMPVEVIFDRFEAGETVEHLAQDYSVRAELVEDLVRRWLARPLPERVPGISKSQ